MLASVNQSLYRVKSGVVQVRQRCQDGSYVERLCKRGQIFGEASLVLLSRDNFTTATAQTDCQVDEVAALFLLKLFEHRPVSALLFCAKYTLRSLLFVIVCGSSKALGALFYRVTANRLARTIVTDARRKVRRQRADSAHDAHSDTEDDSEDSFDDLAWDSSLDAGGGGTMRMLTSDTSSPSARPTAQNQVLF